MATIDAVQVEDTTSTRNSLTYEGWGIAKGINGQCKKKKKTATISNIEWYKIINHYGFAWQEDDEPFFSSL